MHARSAPPARLLGRPTAARPRAAHAATSEAPSTMRTGPSTLFSVLGTRPRLPPRGEALTATIIAKAHAYDPAAAVTLGEAPRPRRRSLATTRHQRPAVDADPHGRPTPPADVCTASSGSLRCFGQGLPDALGCHFASARRSISAFQLTDGVELPEPLARWLRWRGGGVLRPNGLPIDCGEDRRVPPASVLTCRMPSGVCPLRHAAEPVGPAPGSTSPFYRRPGRVCPS